jgi:predicted phosphodiesterase
MAHATPQGDLFEYLPLDRWEERVRDLEDDYVLLGHTHIQGMSTFGKTTVVNPGSVGLARDAARQACYATIEEGRIELKRFPYETELIIAMLRRAPLPEPVIEGLAKVLRGSESR